MLNVYTKQTRSVAEMACPIWNAGLTFPEATYLERLQRTAAAIIRGENQTTYREALVHFKLKSLEERREDICLKFALRAYRHPKFSL